MVRGSWRLAAWKPVLVNTPVPIMFAITIAAVTIRPSRRFGGVMRSYRSYVYCVSGRMFRSRNARASRQQRRATGSQTRAWKAWIPPG